MEHHKRNAVVAGKHLNAKATNQMYNYNGGEFATGQNAASLRIGVYVKYISVWLKYIPPERLLIVKSEDYYKHSEEVVQDIAKFAAGASTTSGFAASPDDDDDASPDAARIERVFSGRRLS